MESVEASGRTIEDAILQALARLGRNRDEVEIAVLQEPSRGVRGMGAREARVRVFLKQGYPPRSTGAVVTPEMADELLPGEDYEGEGEAYFEDGEFAEGEWCTGVFAAMETKSVVAGAASKVSHRSSCVCRSFRRASTLSLCA